MSVNHRDPITGVLTQLAGNGAPTEVGTAALKDFTDVVRAGDHRLVEANAVANAIDQGLSSIYTPRGDIACAELTSSLLIEANIGNVYETSDTGTTSALFIQGADHPIIKGDNIGIIKAGQNDILFNLMGNAFDLHDYQKKDLTNAVEGQETVEGALSALSQNKASADLIPSDASVNNKLISQSTFSSCGIKTIWTGSKTKGDTGMNFDARPYDMCFAKIGGTWCRMITGIGLDASNRKKFTAVYAGRDNANARTYEQYYLFDILPDGTVATCGWFDVGSLNVSNARLAAKQALDLAIAGTATWTDPTWKYLNDVETNVTVSIIVGIKFQTKT